MYKITITRKSDGKEMLSKESYKDKADILLKLLYLAPAHADYKMIEKNYKTEDKNYIYEWRN